jgi:hypothetical protein
MTNLEENFILDAGMNVEWHASSFAPRASEFPRHSPGNLRS